MNIAVLTIFPEMFQALTAQGVIGRAIQRDAVSFSTFNPRDFAKDQRRTVDDRPYGGGPGMLMMAEPLDGALASAKHWLFSKSGTTVVKVIYLTPQGRVLRQSDVKSMACEAENLVLIAGRYEGVDERFISRWVDEEWSIGDYVLSGGELPAMVLVDAVTRLLPGVLGDENSADEDSFEYGLLDCPHYTRPSEYQGLKVPDVLLSGDHEKIAQWRSEQALERTKQRRPDLMSGAQDELEQLEQFRRGLK